MILKSSSIIIIIIIIIIITIIIYRLPPLPPTSFTIAGNSLNAAGLLQASCASSPNTALHPEVCCHTSGVHSCLHDAGQEGWPLRLVPALRHGIELCNLRRQYCDKDMGWSRAGGLPQPHHQPWQLYGILLLPLCAKYDAASRINGESKSPGTSQII